MLSILDSAGILLATWLCYLVALGIYRLYFHRVSHIPGPRLAALTYYYQSYYDFYPHSGQFMFKCAELHERYGPIIRIGPDEVHINDPSYYNEIYASHPRKRDKSTLWYWMVGSGQFMADSTFTTMDHGHHRIRRNAFTPYFSKKKVQDLEPRIRAAAEKLRSRLLVAGQQGEVVDMYYAAAGLTLDVISDYSFGKSVGALDRPDMGGPWVQQLQKGVRVHAFARTFPTVVRTMLNMPPWLMPQTEQIVESSKFTAAIENMTKPVYEETLAVRRALEEKKGSEQPEAEYRTVVHSMMMGDALPESEKTFERMTAEGMNLIGAGTETTAKTLATTFYHVLANKDIHERLLKEVRTLMPDAKSKVPSLVALEKLPYLTAVIHEGTRLGHGVAGRLVRIAPDEDLQYGAFTIPRGATFSQSSYLVNMHPKYFPDPHRFEPERYLGPDSDLAKKSLVPFSKGSRNCAGMNLAYSELYLTMACLIGSLKWELFETTDRDVEVVEEHFLGCFPRDSKGIRVKVAGELAT